MLQPSQLTDVAREYAAEIVDLRAFLAKAGVPVGTSQAIANVASRVQHEKAFHRDLTATLWLTTKGGDRQIGFADLLGVVAIASSGLQLASDAEEQDALALLQFLKEIRRTPKPDATFTPVPEIVRTARSRDAEAVKEPAFERVTQRTGVAAAEHPGVEAEQLPIALPSAFTGPVRNRSPWIIAGSCLVIALLVGGWLYHRSVVPQPGTQQAATPADSNTGSIESEPRTTVRSSGGRNGHETTAVRPEAHREANVGSSRAVTPEGTGDPSTYPLGQPAIASATPANTASTSRPTGNNAAGASIPTELRPAPNPPLAVFAARTATRPANASPVPASTLSKRLGTSTLPQYATEQSSQSAADGPKHPRLLRRHPSTNGDAGLVAELQPLDNPAVRPARSSTGTPVGSVRPTALGIMAANVLYSPTPAYPSAASAAHVTGEVKLEAEIGRDGAVTYARVVSGPPLLREAALSAVQQWRYRPYLSRGKAIPVTALAVMDFQLP